MPLQGSGGSSERYGWCRTRRGDESGDGSNPDSSDAAGGRSTGLLGQTHVRLHESSAGAVLSCGCRTAMDTRRASSAIRQAAERNGYALRAADWGNQLAVRRCARQKEVLHTRNGLRG